MTNRLIRSTPKATKQQAEHITVMGSKYLANRYLMLAAATKGTTRLHNVPFNDDIQAVIELIKTLGATVTQKENSVFVSGVENFIELAAENPVIYCQDSGTLSRFATAFAANFKTEIEIDASQQMRARPMQEIIDGLEQLGVSIMKTNSGCLPIRLKGPIKGGTVELDASRSSQFLSALLLACLQAENDTLIKLPKPLVSKPYVDLTIQAIEAFGGVVTQANHDEFFIPAQQTLSPQDIVIQSDPVSCSYFMAAALIGKRTISIANYDFESKQGEVQFIQVLQSMGANIERNDKVLIVSYEQPLQAVDIDMGNMPDAVPTLVVLAIFAEGETVIRNIAHLALKESNRIVDLCEQLKRLGVACDYDDSSIRVLGGHGFQSGEISSCHDHRLAMSFALLGIAKENIVITESDAVNKSFPTYWEKLDSLGVESIKI